MLNHIKNLFRAELARPIFSRKRFKNKKFNQTNSNIHKKFYIIKQDFNPNGLFSNVTFVLDHINYALKNNLRPVIDMENFLTVYNEKKKIFGSLNAWDYYFKPINKTNLRQVYKSENYIFSKNSRIKKTFINEDKELNKVFKRFIRIRLEMKKYLFSIKHKYFKNSKKIMGVHVRGTLQRVVRGHSFPPNPKDLLKEAIKIFEKTRSQKIFLITEDELYLNIFKKFFKKKLIYLRVPRSNPKFYELHNKHFEDYSRKNHRFKLGRETLVECILLSETKVNLVTDSNVWRISKLFSKKKQLQYQLVTKVNSRNKFIARWKWYFHYYMPYFFGDLSYKIKNLK